MSGYCSEHFSRRCIGPAGDLPTGALASADDVSEVLAGEVPAALRGPALAGAQEGIDHGARRIALGLGTRRIDEAAPDHAAAEIQKLGDVALVARDHHAEQVRF